MTKPIARPGEVVDLFSPATTQESNQRTFLVKTHDVELIQLSVPAASSIPTHKAEGEVVIHCLQGRISATLREQRQELQSGQLLFLNANQPFSLDGIEDASVLVTFISPKEGPNVMLIGEDAPR